MLYYDRIVINKDIDPTKSNKNREYMICHYCFLIMDSNFNILYAMGCHGLSMLCLNISNIAIITVKNVDYHCILYNIRKSEAINLLEDCVLEDYGNI